MFSNIYCGKKVLITGNTGFKGSWLSCWLLKLGAEVIGVSDEVPTAPAMYEDLRLNSKVKQHYCDVRDLETLGGIVFGSVRTLFFTLRHRPLFLRRMNHRSIPSLQTQLVQ